MSGNATRRRTAANVARAMRNATVRPSNLTVRAVAPNAPKRRTAANLAREIMPGPRLPARRPTVPRFTLRRPQPTVAPRNKKNGTVRVRKTAASVAKYLQQLPGRIEHLEGLEIEMVELKDRLRAEMIRLHDPRILTHIFNVGDNIRRVQQTLRNLRFLQYQANRFKREPTMEEMRELMENAPQPAPTEEEMRVLMGTAPQPAPTEEELRLAGLPGIVEDKNSNNE